MLLPLWSVGLLLAVVAVWVAFKVRYYARLSEQQWRRVDKSKLRPVADDEWDQNPPRNPWHDRAGSDGPQDRP